ncbi:NADPH-dependent FMN reductase [Streptacidiphilus anmyonensis]|uniref:NADPH-dependent FMN reductase n=1 Tax=Streptacidiphilus anmyonensis TaxID=405782 RepID=UPI0005A97B1F|nr:NAD(P)H-dependent oxidoreductase [Streptacidiphilus anmyonensis]
MTSLGIITASTRPGRVGPAVGRWVESEALRHGGFAEVAAIDLRDTALPFLDEPHHPRLRNYLHPHTRRWSDTVDALDAFVFVMPEYNHGFNADLKNAIDYLFHEWRYKPVGLVSYGGLAGGTRAAQMIKQVVAAVGMTVVPDAVALPFVGGLVDAAGQLEPAQAAADSLRAVFDELRQLDGALSALREPAAGA